MTVRSDKSNIFVVAVAFVCGAIVPVMLLRDGCLAVGWGLLIADLVYCARWTVSIFHTLSFTQAGITVTRQFSSTVNDQKLSPCELNAASLGGQIAQGEHPVCTVEKRRLPEGKILAAIHAVAQRRCVEYGVYFSGVSGRDMQCCLLAICKKQVSHAVPKQKALRRDGLGGQFKGPVERMEGKGANVRGRLE